MSYTRERSRSRDRAPGGFDAPPAGNRGYDAAPANYGAPPPSYGGAPAGGGSGGAPAVSGKLFVRGISFDVRELSCLYL